MSFPNSEVRLLSNVPLTNKYEHQRTFASLTEQTNYFLGRTAHTFPELTYQREEVAIKVPKGYDELYNCNYLMYRNTDHGTKWFYAFITRREYVNPNTTRVYFELDVFQTWQFVYEIKPSFVVREHTRRWNTDGSPVVNTIDEGLDYGTEYETVSVQNMTPHDDAFFLVIVTKSAMHYHQGTSYINQITPNKNGLPQPLNYYIHPFRMNGTSPTVNLGSISDILTVLEGIFTQENAVNNVVSVYVTEYIGRNISYDGNTMSFSTTNFERVSVSDNRSVNVNTIRVKDLEDFRPAFKNMGNKYNDYANVEESKLLMFPYTVLIMDDMKGNRVEIKNEYINGNTISVRFHGSLGTSNKVSYNIANYLNNTNNQLVELEHGIVNNNPNDLPILSEMLSAYLQGNRNTIENQKSQIMFNAVMGAMGGAVGGAHIGVGGKLGAIAGTTAGMMNAYYQIEGINAKKRDITNTPPNMSKMGGNTPFDYGNGIKGVFLIKKQITAEYRKKLSDFFRMFGYKINEVKVPNIRTRQHYNYVQTVGANVVGDIPHNDLAKIKEMFDNGITFWHGDYVGDYSRVNNER